LFVFRSELPPDQETDKEGSDEKGRNVQRVLALALGSSLAAAGLHRPLYRVVAWHSRSARVLERAAAIRIGDDPSVASEWFEGDVDPEGEHLRLCFGDGWNPLALVARDGESGFRVEFLVDPAKDPAAAEALEAVRRDLDFYLVDTNEPNPWAYAVYHCGTTSNLHSSVHWEHRLPSPSDDQDLAWVGGDQGPCPICGVEMTDGRYWHMKNEHGILEDYA
jgi:hypothetical protein